ncbi:MAG: lytic transglycosylase domain-containing protein [Myxococcota bacterium]
MRVAWVMLGLLALGTATSSPAKAELYSYVDDTGRLHLTTVASPRKAPAADPEGFGGQPPIVIEVQGTPTLAYAVDVTRYDDILERAARHYRLPFAFLKAVAKVESNFNPRAVSSAEAKGLMQLIDETASSLEVEDVFDPEQNVFGGARYLRILANRFDGDLKLVAAAYNAGPERVERLGRVPNIRETRRYVQRVLQMYRYYLGVVP